MYESVSSYSYICKDLGLNLRNTEDFYILKGNTAFQPKNSFHLTDSGPDSQLPQISGKKGNFYHIYWYLTQLSNIKVWVFFKASWGHLRSSGIFHNGRVLIPNALAYFQFGSLVSAYLNSYYHSNWLRYSSFPVLNHSLSTNY